MNKSFVLAGVCAAMISGAGAAQAGTETFDNPVTLSATAAPGAWYTDRFAPAGFATSYGNLVESIAGHDLQADGFYNTQGRAFDLGPTQSMSIDLFVDGNFRGSNQRDAGFWGVADDNTNSVSAYPIVELSDLDNNLVFRGWDSNNASWTTIASADSLVGSWQTLTISLNTVADTFTYTAGGSSLTLNAGGSTAINSVILQGYNVGANYNISWDNLTTPAAGGVPEPAAWALMILGFGGVGAVMRRKRLALA